MVITQDTENSASTLLRKVWFAAVEVGEYITATFEIKFLDQEARIGATLSPTTPFTFNVRVLCER